MRGAIKKKDIVDSKSIDNQVRYLLINTKDKLEQLNNEIKSLKIEEETLKASLELNRSQLETLLEKEVKYKKEVIVAKQEKDELKLKQQELEQTNELAKEELQRLPKLYKESIHFYNVKIKLLNDKERQSVLQTEEKKARIEHKIVQTKKDNEDLKVKIEEMRKKIERINKVIERAEENNEEQGCVYEKELGELEALVFDAVT